MSRLPGYEFRPQQLEAALALEGFLRNPASASFALEAPTGVGKTFAVLVPALRESLKRDVKVLFLTASIALQEQLIEKDLPRIRQIMGRPFEFGLLKGRSNYACLYRARMSPNEPEISSAARNRAHPCAARGTSASFASWLSDTETGDLTELELPANSPERLAIAAGAKNCLGTGCPFRNKCFILKAYRNAQDWDIVVANYNLYFSHILEGSGAFPVKYDWLICDEAHRIPDAVRSASSVRAGSEAGRTLFSKKTLRAFNKFLKSQSVALSDMPPHAERAEEELRKIFDVLSARDSNSIQEPDEDLLNRGHAVAGELDSMLRPLRPFEDRFMSGDLTDKAVLAQGTELMKWIDDVREFKRSLIWCLSVERFPKWAYWAETASGEYSASSLMSKPVDAGEIAREILDKEKPEKLILTSATLTLSGKMDFWSRESGIIPDDSLTVSSPFDFRNQMEILVIDVGLKVMAKGYDDLMCRVMKRLCDENGGRTLVLLSSLRLMRAFAEKMRDTAAHGYTVLVQGELPQRQILKQFMEDETSVLIGSASFREGVDVPGEGLTQVIIDRIPFPHPNDPIVRARDAMEGGKGFIRFSLPTARMFLKQAAGRLIRSSSDHGRVVLLDGRALEHKNWGILESFPPCRVKAIRLKT